MGFLVRGWGGRGPEGGVGEGVLVRPDGVGVSVYDIHVDGVEEGEGLGGGGRGDDLEVAEEGTRDCGPDVG